MKIVIDVNLSPDWVTVLKWSSIGSIRATDQEILEWARLHDHVIFTHDLDFGSILAASKATTPSVIQVRTQDVSPAYLEHLVVRGLAQFQAELTNGAVIVVDESRLRARILPIHR